MSSYCSVVTQADVVTGVSWAFSGSARMCVYLYECTSMCALTQKPLDISSPNLADG